MNNSSMKIFDRHAVRLHRERAADGFGSFSFLFREAAERLVDRLFDIRREFPLTLDLGSQGVSLPIFWRDGIVYNLLYNAVSRKNWFAEPQV